MKRKVNTYFALDCGKVRKNNEDRAAIIDTNDVQLLLVCDGMGGHKKGEVASQLAIDIITSSFEFDDKNTTEYKAKKVIRKVMKKANSEINNLATTNPNYADMGTTVVMAVVLEDTTLICNCGDSRAYSYSKEYGLKQLTTDQTYVQYLYSLGKIKKEEIKTHPKRHILMNAMGINPTIDYDIISIPNDYDSLLLASDGFTNKILKVLGEGGMAIVYLANDIITNKEVAVKIIKEETMKNPLNLTRFEREARAAASLNHQNIVKVITLGTFEGRPYMVNEFIKGKTLRETLNVRVKFSFLEACDIMYQLCSAVWFAHQHGVIHRDIKPQNVFITVDGTVKLGDFGIATFQNSSHVTRSEVVVGSVHYLAPEISQGNQATPQSDIYSLGITFFELITGRVPFDDESAVTVALKHIKEKFPSVRKYNPKTPVIIEKIIMKACNKNPYDRYKSVFDMRRDIERILREPDLIKKKESFWSRLFHRSGK